jgi:tol-pal system protein YbgF
METMKMNMTRLQIESTRQNNEIAQIKNELSQLSNDVSSLKNVSSLKEHSLGAIREGQAATLTQISGLSREIQMLKGRFEESRFFMDRTARDWASERELLNAKIASLEKEIKQLNDRINALAAMPEPQAPHTPGRMLDPHAAIPPAVDPKRLYDDAHIAFQERRYAEAKQKFEQFIKDFPKHAFVPHAHYWIGESYFEDKKFEDAILAYETFLRQYPNHERVKDAMLKQAYAFIELRDIKTGRVILERLIEKYPNSREAELAKKKIAEIAPRKAPPPKRTR